MRRLLMAVFLSIAGVTCAGAQCVAPNTSGEKVVAREMQDSELRDFWASSTYDASGHPTISFGRLYGKLPPVMRRFSRLHECGHLVARLNDDEYEANCYALRAGRFSKKQVAEI